MKKRVVTGDFVTRDGYDGSWMITTIAKIIAVFVFIYFYISLSILVDKIPKPATILVTEEKI